MSPTNAWWVVVMRSVDASVGQRRREYVEYPAQTRVRPLSQSLYPCSVM
jgi:hypothetical protein